MVREERGRGASPRGREELRCDVGGEVGRGKTGDDANSVKGDLIVDLGR